MSLRIWRRAAALAGGPARRALLAAALLLAVDTAPASAQALTVPPDRRERLFELIDDACPECRRTGFHACGGQAIGLGARFAPAAFQGTPRRAYLVTFVMSGEEFRNGVRGTPYGALEEAIQRRFAKARLLVVEDGFAGVRVLDQSPRVEVDVPRPLHACVADPARPWSCCAAPACREECCEKSLGSPVVRLHWSDARAGETIRFDFAHTPGDSRLTRGATTYFCLAERAQLR